MKKDRIDKQTKLNMNYFTKTDTLKIIGGAILVIGLLSLWLGRSWGFFGFILGILLTPAGIVIFIVGSIGRVNDSDVDSYITNKMAGFEIDIDTDKSYHLKLLKNVKEITLEGNLFPEGVMVKRLKTGELRSSSFCRTKIRILSDRLYILTREISLIYEDQVNDILREPLYDNIKSISVERDQLDLIFMKSFYLVKTCHLVISTTDGDIRIPCIDAITTDELADNLNRRLSAYAKAKEDAQADQK